MMRIVFVDHLYLSNEHKLRINDLGEVVFYENAPINMGDIIDRVKNTDIIVVNRTQIHDQIIECLDKTKYIITSSVGYNHIDASSANFKKIKVINCPMHCSDTVAEHTIGLMLAISRKIPQSNFEIKRGHWRSKPLIGEEIRGKNICLIGQGSVGRRVLELATCLGMKVNYADSETESEALDTLIKNADFISLHVPLTNKTWHLIDSRRLNLMRKTAYIINTSRGSIIEQPALFEALKNKKIGGAALDVFEEEPTDNKINQEVLKLAELDNVVLTPHIAYNSEESSSRLGEELISNLESCITGSPINVVN
jgi:phosphoglycerate dehydrogenase-like enzyme